MAKPPVSLLVVLDSGLTYGLQKLLLFMLVSLLPILGVIGLFFAYESCFEYGRGIFELSRFEIIAFVLFIALERRFAYYCRLFDYSFWQGLIKLFSVLGVASLIVGVGALLSKALTSAIEPNLLQPLWLITYLLALYLCPPAALIDHATQNNSRVEPTLNTSDKESKS
ncbi:MULTISPECIES: hypothetical protein [Pseudomonas]|uniref:hypothetical protein n=1 Tax=Pseudomonas TaxID=286 RepID=UPI0008E78877|nr:MULTISPECIES: hypothetical protein [Pseudomonas]SFU17952.1 hypothetical protein SAMN05216264_11863 [Pseudomonas marincola]